MDTKQRTIRSARAGEPVHADERFRRSRPLASHVSGELEVNVGDTALIFEGGGMRASATAGVVATLIEQGINFGDVYGISAGTSHAANYLSRDVERARASFVDLVCDPQFGGMGDMVRGEGFFNAHYLYEEMGACRPCETDVRGFDWETFRANPANVHIEAFDCEDGYTVGWSKRDIRDLSDLLVRVRASSSMPVFMPETVVEGRSYLDGGLGSSWGIPLEAAAQDGYERFFIVRTRKRGYRKRPLSSLAELLVRTALRARPLVAESVAVRWLHYNAIADEIDRLEQEGAAYVFYPDEVSVSSRETDLARLERSYDAGYAQAQREAPAWKAWLGL